MYAWHRMRLWLRLTLAMAVLAVVPVGVLGWLAVDATTRGAMVRPDEELNREATSIATFVSAWTDALRAQLAGWYRVWSLDDRDEAYQVGLLRAIHTAVSDVAVIGLVDERMQPVVPMQWLPPEATEEGREPGSEVRVRELLAHLPATLEGEVTIGAPYLPTGAGGQSVAVVVNRPGARFKLVAEVSLGAIAAVFPAQGERVAAMFAGPGEPVFGAHESLRSEQIGDVVALGMDMVFSPSDGRGDLRGAAARVAGVGWLVVVAEPTARAEQLVASLRLQTGLVVAIALAAVGAMGVLLHQQITAPVSHLRRVVGLLAAGDYDQRTRLERGDELGELALDLNHMAERLERARAEILAQREEILSFNDELQARVDARTAELQAAQGRLVRASQVAAIAEVGAGLAHELNNPLAAILGMAQVLQARGQGDTSGLARIEQQAQRCRDVVETMVRFASGDIDPARAPVIELTRAVRESTEVVAAAFAQRGVRLVVDLPAADVRARLDPVLAGEILRRWLELFRAGLPEGASLGVSVLASNEGPTVTLTPSHALAGDGALDDWRAAGVQIWVARRLLDRTGGHVGEPTQTDPSWRLVLPGEA